MIFMVFIIINFSIILLAGIIAIFINEFTKAFTSYCLGDITVKNKKQLTLNPFKYIDPIGFLFVIGFFGYGFGKPAELNVIYYKNRDRGILIVHTIPIIANIVFAFLFYNLEPFWEGFYTIGHYSLALGIFNLIPIYPLCGEKILKYFLNPNASMKYAQIEPFIRMIVILFISSMVSPLNYVVGFFEKLLNLLVFIR